MSTRPGLNLSVLKRMRNSQQEYVSRPTLLNSKLHILLALIPVLQIR